MTTEKCPHGEFELTEGCPQCVAEKDGKRLEASDEVKTQFRESVLRHAVEIVNEHIVEEAVANREITIELEEQIKVVAEARVNAQGAEDYKNRLLDEWKQRNADLFSTAVKKVAVRAEAEALLRELTLKAYKETGNKAPAVGVGIREVTKLEYDESDAFKWATDHKLALKLDTSSFEKYVKLEPQNFKFVTIFQEPIATIATKLEM